MTVTNTNNFVSYISTGAAGPYPFTFPVTPDDTALIVTLTDLAGVTTTVSSSDYTAADINGSYLNGGTITLDVAPPAGYTLIIQRNTPETQTSSFTDGMPQPYKTFEYGLDKLTMICQQLQSHITALSASQSSPSSQPIPFVFTGVVSHQVVDASMSCATGDDQAYFRVPSILDGFHLVSVAACCQTAGITGTMTIQVRNATTNHDMLSTAMTIDSGEKDTITAAIPAVINTVYSTVHTADQICLADIDAVHTTAAKGLEIELMFQP